MKIQISCLPFLREDPHVIDMLAGAAQGEASEAAAQHTALGAFNKDAQAPTPADLAEVPMIYPGK